MISVHRSRLRLAILQAVAGSLAVGLPIVGYAAEAPILSKETVITLDAGADTESDSDSKTEMETDSTSTGDFSSEGTTSDSESVTSAGTDAQEWIDYCYAAYQSAVNGCEQERLRATLLWQISASGSVPIRGSRAEVWPERYAAAMQVANEHEVRCRNEAWDAFIECLGE